jgi:adenosylcobyric acid synthase
MQTTLSHEKQLKHVSGRLLMTDAEVKGYEIHAGISQGQALLNPLMKLEALLFQQ